MSSFVAFQRRRRRRASASASASSVSGAGARFAGLLRPRNSSNSQGGVGPPKDVSIERKQNRSLAIYAIKDIYVKRRPRACQVELGHGDVGDIVSSPEPITSRTKIRSKG